MEKNYLRQILQSILFLTLPLMLISVPVQAQVITPGDPGNFITTWKTDNPGNSADDQVIIFTNGSGSNYHVYWEDVNNASVNGTETGLSGNATITFPQSGTYRIEIAGGFSQIYCGNVDSDAEKLIALNQWGDIQWTSMNRAFSTASEMEYYATDAPDLSGVTDMESMFVGAQKFNGDISDWDVSNVTNMNGTFSGASLFNGDIGEWDVSNVTIMLQMFSGALSFDQNLSSWDLSNVTNMGIMFSNAGLSTANYDATLIGWAANPSIQQDIQFGANGLAYCAGAAARQSLIDNYGWTINGDIQSADCDGDGAVVTPGDPGNFITTWQTDNPGESEDNQITLPIHQDGGYNFSIAWGDGNQATWQDGDDPEELTHTYAAPGAYTVEITGDFPRIYFDGRGDRQKVLSIEQWGDIAWSSMEDAFNGAINVMGNATDAPDLSGVTSLVRMFQGAGMFNGNIGSWDVSGVTDMSGMFTGANSFNQDIGSWIVSNVTNMDGMFVNAYAFNQDISSWKVENVTNMNSMFRNAVEFNQDISGWDVSQVTIMQRMFFNTPAFDVNMGNWDVSKVTDMFEMLSQSGLSPDNYDATLTGWAGQEVQSGITLGADDLEYCASASERQSLIDDHGWTISGDTQAADCDGDLTPDANNVLYVDINVNTTAGGYTGAGDSWANAVPELADAMKWAREQHDGGSPGWTETKPLRIFVAKGTYLPLYHAADAQYTTDGGRDNSFVLVPNVQVYGGFDPTNGIETLTDARMLPDMNSLEQGSILSGDFDGNDNPDNFDNHTENAYHVTIVSGEVGSALVDGFTIAGGFANSSGGVAVFGGTIRKEFGGGTSVMKSSPQLTHVVWFNNFSSRGGGLYNSVTYLTDESLPKLKQVTFYRNMAYGGGGGICNFAGSLEIRQATFAYNGAGSVRDPTATGPGGGIYTSGNGTSLKVTNATFYGNWIVGVIPGHNRDGGAIHADRSTTTLHNVVVWGNEVEDDSTAPSASISSREAAITITNSLVAQSGGSENWDGDIGTDGGNNIDMDPAFVNTIPDYGGFLQLQETSPVVNAGSNQLYTDAGGNLANDLDLASNPRVYNYATGGVIDMGAYEFQGAPTSTIVSLSTPDTITVDYGTSLNAIENLPTEVTATLSDSTEAPVALDGNTGNWTLKEPEDGTYDGKTVGTYLFTVPLVLPEPGDAPYFLNPDELLAEITVTVAKGLPELTASWNDTDIDPAAGLSLGYGDGGTLAFDSSDPNAKITYGFGENDTPVLNLENLETVVAQQAGTATLTVQQAETDNFEAATLSFTVSVAPAAITVVPESGQAKVYGEDDPSEYGYALAEGSELRGGDGLSEIISGSSREEGEDAGAYDIILTFEGEKAANYDITFEEDNNAFAVTPFAITVTAEDKSRVYGADDPELTYMVTPPLLGDDAFTGILERETGETVGTYNITQGTLTAGNNYTITFEEGTLTITTADYEDITFSDAEFTYDGTEHSLAITGELPEGTSVTYQNNGRTDAGTQTVTAQVDGGENYEDMELTADLTITPLSILVTADNQQKAYGVDDPELTYTADPLIGSDSFIGILERETGETVGDYAITQGTLTAGNNYAVIFEEGTLTITTADYEDITFNAGEFTYDGTEHTLALTGELPEGTSVTYQNNGRTDAGTQTVTVEIDGGENYENMELTADLTITPLSIAVTADNQQKTYSTDDPELTYTTDQLIGDDTFTGTLEREVGEAVGEYAITQGTLTAGNNYIITFEEGTLTITTADYEDITFSDGEFIYDGTEHSLAITGELPEGSSVTYQNNGRTDAGTQTVTAEIDGGENYENMELTADLTITPLSIAVTADNQQKAYGRDDPELTYTTDQLIGDNTFTGTLEREAGEAVGEYAITQGTLTAGNNYAITLEEGTLTITLADYENITFNAGEFTYDGTEHVLTITGELPEGTSVTYQNNGRTDAGTQTITAEIDGGENYEDMELTADLTITPLSIAVTADNQQKTYGTDDSELTYTADPLIGSDSFTGTLERKVGEAVGDYAITQGTLTAGNNYAVIFEEGTLTITTADYENITFSDAEFTYDGTEHRLALTGELPEGTSVTYQNNGRAEVGTQMVTANISGSNYDNLVLTAELEVTPATLSIIADSQSKVYGEADPELTYKANGLMGGDSISGALGRESGEAVGDYAIVQGTLTASSNYDITYKAAVFAIAPANLDNIAFNDDEFIYDGSEHRLAITDELPEGAEVSYENNAKVVAGVYEVTATIGKENYHDLELTARLIIEKAEAIITADTLQAFTYDGRKKNVAARLNHSETVLEYSPRHGYTHAGSYPITISSEESSNYLEATKEVLLVIEEGEIKDVAFEDATFTYDGSEHHIYISGLPEGGGVSYDNNGKTDAGNYTVTATISMDNYSDKVLSANLLINKAVQEINFEEIADRSQQTDDYFQLDATSSSGLPIVYSYTYNTENPAATVEPRGFVQILNRGEVSITAMQEGNQNYEAASPVVRTLTIIGSEARLNSVTFNGTKYSNPDEEVYYLMICGKDKNEVHIQLEPNQGAVTDKGNEFTITTPVPGIYRERVTVTSEDGNTTRTYIIIVEKNFNFEDIVVQKFNNVLLVNNNPETNGGYKFVNYKWYKNGSAIGHDQYYSAGNDSGDQLDPDSDYYVEMETEDGEVLRTCISAVQLRSSPNVSLTPNPVRSGGTMELSADFPKEELKTMELSIHSLNGVFLKKVRGHSKITRISIPHNFQIGVYLLRIKTRNISKTLKFIVK